jgi:gluconate 2-dehydrogenase gamma chain
MLGELMMQDIAQMDRRALMRNVALLLGAATVPTLAGCKAAMEGKGTLDERQMKLLTGIADTIMPKTDTPGAAEVGVPKLISGMLRDWASPESRTAITGAIDKIGKLGSEKGFAALDAAKRTELLLAFDKEAVKPDPNPKYKPSGLAAMRGGGATPMDPGYVKLKGLIINLYYNSEMAMTKELIYEHVPGKFVASLPVTPETRPFAGVGGLG